MLFLRHNYLNTITMLTISAGAGGTASASKLFDNRKSTQYQSSGNDSDATTTVITVNFTTTQTISHIILRNHNLRDYFIQYGPVNSGKFWVTDNLTSKIYNIGQAGTILSSFTSSANIPTGITIASNGTLWVSDYGADKIFNIGQAGTDISSFSTPADNPRGVALDNNGTLWLADFNSATIYNLGLAGTVISSFTTPSNGPKGLTMANDGTLWLADSNSDLIYNLGQAGTVISSFTTPSTAPTGLTIADDGTLWLIDETSDLIYNLGQAGTVISSFTTPTNSEQGITILENTIVNETNNSQTSNYHSFTTITTNRIQLTAKKTNPANNEKKIGEFIISKLLYDFTTDRLPPAKAYKPDLFRKQVIHKMSDGGVTLYNISEKFKAQLGFTFLPTTSASILRTIYESKDPFNFLPWETTTSWDGDIFEVNWMGGYGLMGFSDNDLGNGYKGKMKIQETPGR